MPSGRPAKPVELKKKQGTYRPDRDQSLKAGNTNNVVAFTPVKEVPEHPADFKQAAQQSWIQVWSAGASWINPATDWQLVESVCRMADLAAAARERALVTTDPADMRAAIQANNEHVRMLSLLGFTPADRTKMGYQQIQTASTLDKLRKRNA